MEAQPVLKAEHLPTLVNKLKRNGYWTSLLLGEACALGNDILLKPGLANHALRYEQRRHELSRYLYDLGKYNNEHTLVRFEFFRASSPYGIKFKDNFRRFEYRCGAAIPILKFNIQTQLDFYHAPDEQIKLAISDLNSRLK